MHCHISKSVGWILYWHYIKINFDMYITPVPNLYHKYAESTKSKETDDISNYNGHLNNEIVDYRESIGKEKEHNATSENLPARVKSKL